MRAITLKLPDHLNERLTSTARERHTTKSAVAREALEQFLKHPVKKRKLSALEQMGDLVGSLEGPGDLSTNPKYMEGFGE